MTASPEVAEIARAWELPPLHEFRLHNGISGAEWTHEGARDKHLTADLPADTLIISHQVSPVMLRNIWLCGQSKFSGRLAPRTWTVMSSNGMPEAHVAPGFRVVHIYIPAATLRRHIEGLGLDLDLPDAGQLFNGDARSGMLIDTTGRIARHMRSEETFRQADLDAGGHALMLELARLWHHRVPVRTGQRLGERLTGYQCRQVQDFIEASLEQALTLSDLAAVLGLSRAHFARAYRNSTGHAPMQAVEAARMRRAIALLSGTRHSVTEIALRVGFNDPAYFARVFRKSEGCTPSEFRRLCRGGAV